MKSFVIFAASLAVVFGEVFIKEEFSGSDISNWIQSTSRPVSERGEFKLSAGKFYGDAEKDKGIQTSQDARFYQLSAKLDKSFSNEGKQLVLQFTVKHEQNIDCGGGYVKLFPKDLKPESMNGDSPYYVMFGPDICGPGTKKVHVIITYKGKNNLIKKDIRCKDDEMTHLYTFILNSDNTYEVRIDGEKAESGKLEEDWDLLAPKKIKDPNEKKPTDWVDEAKIDDPEDKKPEDWDNEPELIPDPDAKKPEDWDNEEDGEWEAPQINNPKFKGVWKAKQIDNPAYKGEWVHPEIDNPEYVADDHLYKFPEEIGYVGFEIWQVKSGTIFDNIIVTDDVTEAEAHAKETFEVTKVAEKEMKDKIDAEEKKKQEEEDAKREAEEKKEGKDGKDGTEAEDDDDDDEDDEKDEDKDAPVVDATVDKTDATPADKEDATDDEPPKDEL